MCLTCSCCQGCHICSFFSKLLVCSVINSHMAVLDIFQVTVLLKECRDIQLRCGSIGFDTVDVAVNSPSRTHTETEAEKVISEHLVSFVASFFFLYLLQLVYTLITHVNLTFRKQLTFKDINGLVEQNAQLRSLARSLSDQIENKEREFKVCWK